MDPSEWAFAHPTSSAANTLLWSGQPDNAVLQLCRAAAAASDRLPPASRELPRKPCRHLWESVAQYQRPRPNQPPPSRTMTRMIMRRVVVSICVSYEGLSPRLHSKACLSARDARSSFVRLHPYKDEAVQNCSHWAACLSRSVCRSTMEQGQVLVCGWSCRTTFNNELWISIPPL